MKDCGCFLRPPEQWERYTEVCNPSLISRHLLTYKKFRPIPKRFHFHHTHYTIENWLAALFEGWKRRSYIYSPTSQMETANNWDDSSVFGRKEVDTDQPGSLENCLGWLGTSHHRVISQEQGFPESQPPSDSKFTPSSPSASSAPFQVYSPSCEEKSYERCYNYSGRKVSLNGNKGNTGVKVDLSRAAYIV